MMNICRGTYIYCNLLHQRNEIQDY